MQDTQKSRILRHLQDCGSITPLDALREYGVYRLSAIIHTLRNEGNNIGTEMVKFTNRYGKPNNYAKYTYSVAEVGETIELGL